VRLCEARKIVERMVPQDTMRDARNGISAAQAELQGLDANSNRGVLAMALRGEAMPARELRSAIRSASLYLASAENALLRHFGRFGKQ